MPGERKCKWKMTWWNKQQMQSSRLLHNRVDNGKSIWTSPEESVIRFRITKRLDLLIFSRHFHPKRQSLAMYCRIVEAWRNRKGDWIGSMGPEGDINWLDVKRREETSQHLRKWIVPLQRTVITTQDELHPTCQYSLLSWPLTIYLLCLYVS